MKQDIIIVGVGGQGTLLASKIIGNIALKNGLDIKVSEVHGMAQRGGSVITHVRIGKEILSPLVSEKEGDFILAFEELEAGRGIPFLKKGGTLIVNTQEIYPMPVISGTAQYPENPFAKAFKIGRVQEINALAIAQECGNAKAVNMVLLGKLASYLPWEKKQWHKAIEESVKPQTIQTNLNAFDRGAAWEHR
ncbi:MAG: indolepyruvate oxidoreductase subunit beta [Clostridiales bacterium]|nr:indolepyruvate oxidoreductase subunit beta [Clostridiales bacterium]